MEEIWRPVKGYEGRYEVSNFGRVKSLSRLRKGRYNSAVPVKERILKLKTDKDGYKEAALSLGIKREMKFYRVHRLVAEAFIPNPNNLPIINHKDENPANNCVNNLEWCTYQYNRQYSLRKVSFSIVYDEVIYPSIRECSRQLGLDCNTIRYHLKRNTPYKGHLFKLITEQAA